MPENDRFAHTLERFKVGDGIPATELMVGDHRDPDFKKLGYVREVHEKIGFSFTLKQSSDNITPFSPIHPAQQRLPHLSVKRKFLH